MRTNLDLSRAPTATDLIAQMTADETGRVAVALYDTARLVALAPGLAGHEARLEHLLREQGRAGVWGGPEGYAVVPTLSATAALLTELHRAGAGTDFHRAGAGTELHRAGAGTEPHRAGAGSEHRAGAHRDRLARAAARGLRALRRLLDPRTGPAPPDTIAVELVVPALVEELNALIRGRPTADRGPELPPDAFDRRLLDGVRARFAVGVVPQRLWACLEVFGAAAAAAPLVHPARGAVGCSPAATAAWLGGPGGDPAATRYLEALQARGGGPVPAVSPITYFEPAWVLNSLAAGGWAGAAPAALLDRLDEGLTPDGCPAAPGLPADADDTAAVLAALLRHGRIRAPDCLLGYRTGGHFACFPDERTPSVSTNAHVLEALALYLARRPGARARFAGPAAAAAGWLRDQQHADGSWSDKWHASPYYATACCVTALALHGGVGSGGAGPRPLDRAVAWVLGTQRADGSWGRWHGTVEETAYAVQVLAAVPTAGAAAAVRRGIAFLAESPPEAAHPPLWHAKDLYAPVAVVRAAQLGALRMGMVYRPVTGADAARSARGRVAVG